jgi:hypothetical protein
MDALYVSMILIKMLLFSQAPAMETEPSNQLMLSSFYLLEYTITLSSGSTLIAIRRSFGFCVFE